MTPQSHWCRPKFGALSLFWCFCAFWVQQQQQGLFPPAVSVLVVSVEAFSVPRGAEPKPKPPVRRNNNNQNGNKKKNPWAAQDADLLHRSYSRARVAALRNSNNNTAATATDPDYIVIGSGIGGLWLAAALAKFNRTCLVLEQHSTAGGLQHTFRASAGRKGGGYEFVPGLHYIANLPLCAPLYELVADDDNASNITYIRAGDAVPADRGARSSHDLKIGALPVLHVQEGVDRARAELTQHFPDQSAAISEFLRLTERAKWQAGQFSTFKIFPRWLQFLTSQWLCSTYVHYASLTTAEALAALNVTDGRLRTVLSAFGGDLGESIADGSFAMQAAVLGHVLEGCHYPEGGPPQFARGLVPPIRRAGGDVLVKARVEQILIENGRATGVRLAAANGGDEIRSRRGVVSDAGMGSTLFRLLPKDVVRGPLKELAASVRRSSGGISHVFCFVGFNATNEALGLRSSSFYYIPCNASRDMDASEIQEFYRNTLLDPSVPDVSAGIVFASAKDPAYSARTMPGKSTAIIFSEARDSDFLPFLEGAKDPAFGRGHAKRSEAYLRAKEIIREKMLRSLLLNFPQVEPNIEVVEVATPLTMLDYTLRTDTLGLRHTPDRMCDMELRPDCKVPGLYFTGQDVAFAGWAGALTGAMVTTQKLLGYTLFDFMNKKTLMRDLGGGHVEDMIQQKVAAGVASTPWEIFIEVLGNARRHLLKNMWTGRKP